MKNASMREEHRGDLVHGLQLLEALLEPRLSLMSFPSCPRFLANPLRVLLTAAAYVLMQELRRRAAGTSLATAQVSTLRERLLKLSARIERSVRRMVVHLPHSAAYQCEWRRIARSLGAVPA